MESRGYGILHLAVGRFSSSEVASLLDRGADINVLGDSGDSILFSAVDLRASIDPAMIDLLLHRGAKPRTTGFTLVHFLALHGDPGDVVIPLMGRLLDLGVDVNAYSPATIYGKGTALMLATSQYPRVSSDRIVFLIDEGTDVNLYSEYPNFSYTALHAAASKHPDTKIASLLLDGGADINVAGGGPGAGFTPLH